MRSICSLANEVLVDPERVQIGATAPAETVSHALFPVALHLKTVLPRFGCMSGFEEVFFEVVHGLDDIQERLVHPLGAGVFLRCGFLVDIGLSLGFDPMKVLRMFFQLQAMLFAHVLDGLGINLSKEIIGLGHQFLDTFRCCIFSHHVSFR
jgi:hypothetical protein